MSHKNNLVLFPNVKQKLIEASLAALQAKDYAEALENIDELLKYGVQTYEINVGKLISLIHFKQLDDALTFCETLLDSKHEHYIEYVDYYLMILYEKGLYFEVIEEIKELKAAISLPVEYEEKFSMMQQLANQLNEEENQLTYAKFQGAVIDGNHTLQWHYLHQLKDRNAQATDLYLHLLMQKSVHPVIKTYILSWFQSIGAKKRVEVEKFQQVQSVQIDLIPIWNEHPKYIKVKQIIREVEQNNPTMYELVTALLDSYFYVNYPMIEKGSVETIAAALIHVAKTHLAMMDEDVEIDENLQEYIELINLSHEVYLSIVSN